MRAGFACQSGGGAGGHDAAAFLAAFGAEVDQPVGGADHVEVVLDHQQRVAGREQLAQRAQQLRHVVEVQAGGRLVEHEELAAAAGAREGLARAPGQRGALARGFGEEAGELEPLRFAARQRRHRLAEPQVVEADLGERPQPRLDVVLAGEQLDRLVHGQFEHVGDRAPAPVPAGQRDLEDLRPEALPVAVRAAQVDVGQELHLDVLEAVAAAGRAAAVAGVEAEGAGGVSALLRERRGGEALADRVERADVAGRVAARGLADRRLVDEDDVADPVVAEQPVVRPGRLGGSPARCEQRRQQHALHQRRLAAAGHSGQAYEAPERNLDRDVLEVVCARALEDQLRGGGDDGLRAAGVDLPAAREIVAGQRAGLAQRARIAVEHDLPAALAGAGSDVDHPVGGEHHLRIVLDDDQRISRVAQSLHHLDHAVHVARMQADRRLVEHEQRVDQRGAQRRGQVDPLHLAARQRARLAVERQVAEPDLAQVAQPRADLRQQKLRCAVERRRQRERVEECRQPVDRQQHQVVDRVPADAPQQRVGLEPCSVAGRALGVRAVLRQQHADVHPVRLRLEPVEEAPDPVPLLLPLAAPVVAAVDDPAALRVVQFAPRHVHRHAGRRGVPREIALAVAEARGLPRLHRALGQRAALVGDHEPEVDADHAAEAAAGLAGAQRRVEREQARQRIGVGDVAVGAVQAGAEAPARDLFAVLAERVRREAPVAAREGGLDRFGEPRRFDRPGAKAVLHDVHHVCATGAGGLDGVDARVALRGEMRARLLLGEAGRQRHREGEHESRVAGRAGASGQRRAHVGDGVAPNRQAAAAAVQRARAREQQLQVVVELGHRADRRARRAHRIGLVDGDRRRHAVDAVDLRPVHPVEELPRVGREGLDVAALALGVQRVEHQRGLARTRHAGDHHQLAGRDVEVDVLQVVLARTADADRLPQHRLQRPARRLVGGGQVVRGHGCSGGTGRPGQSISKYRAA